MPKHKKIEQTIQLKINLSHQYITNLHIKYY
jgi:hypothetical protein